jgi:hypothetical protein
MVLFTPCVQLTIAAQHASHPLEVALLTTVTPNSGFFSEDVEIKDPLAFVRDHTERMPDYEGIHLQALVTGLFLGGGAWTLSVPPVRWSVPPSAEPVSYLLGETIALQGYEVRDDPGGTEVVLYWQALAHTEADYSVLVHLLRDGAERVAQSDGYPAEGHVILLPLP